MYKEVLELKKEYKQINQKIDKRYEQKWCQRRYINGQQAHENMLNNIITETQIKTQMRCYFTSTRMATINKNKTDNNKCQGCGEMGSLIHCWWGYKTIQPLWKIIWQFIKKLNIKLLYYPAIPLLGIHPKEMKMYIHAKTCKQMFTAALFIIAPNWKLPKMTR